jgi:hypothetical protein
MRSCCWRICVHCGRVTQTVAPPSMAARWRPRAQASSLSLGLKGRVVFCHDRHPQTVRLFQLSRSMSDFAGCMPFHLRKTSLSSWCFGDPSRSLACPDEAATERSDRIHCGKRKATGVSCFTTVRRASHSMAAALYGSPDSQRSGLFPTSRIHSAEPVQASIGR